MTRDAAERRVRFSSAGWICGALTAVSLGASADQWEGPQPGRIFHRLDANGDAIVDHQELEVARREMFAHADADGDGYVTEAEAHDLRDSLREQGGAGQNSLLRPRYAARRPAEQANLLARFDTDGDGRVAQAEFVAAEHPFLARFDSNGDGRLTRAEVEEGEVALRESFRERRAAR
jgi:Ca2+-binding EF-hand superfamily protein